jgi:SAM-dependent methyltransferase
MLSEVHRALGAQLRSPRGWPGCLLARLLGPLNADSNQRAVEALAIEAGEKVLELGFGPGDALRLMAQSQPNAFISAIDHSQTMVVHAARRLQSSLPTRSVTLLQGRLDSLPFRDDVFDKLLAVHVAYFFAPDGPELREAHRVLRQGGRIVLLVTSKDALTRWRFDALPSHRLLDQKNIVDELSRAGFERHAISISTVRLRFGVEALLATSQKAVHEHFG